MLRTVSGAFEDFLTWVSCFTGRGSARTTWFCLTSGNLQATFFTAVSKPHAELSLKYFFNIYAFVQNCVRSVQPLCLFTWWNLKFLLSISQAFKIYSVWQYRAGRGDETCQTCTSGSCSSLPVHVDFLFINDSIGDLMLESSHELSKGRVTVTVNSLQLSSWDIRGENQTLRQILVNWFQRELIAVFYRWLKQLFFINSVAIRPLHLLRHPGLQEPQGNCSEQPHHLVGSLQRSPQRRGRGQRRPGTFCQHHRWVKCSIIQPSAKSLQSLQQHYCT